MSLQPEHGTLAARITVAAGQSKTIHFAISWRFPQGDIYWAYRDKPDGQIPNRDPPNWKNYYATQWPDSSAGATDALTRRDGL